MTPADLVQRLTALRDLLAPGWTEPFCRDTEGRMCSESDEGVASFSLFGALRLVCKPGEADEVYAAIEAQSSATYLEAATATEAALANWNAETARRALRACRAAGADESLLDWLRSNREHSVRMRLLAFTIQRAKAQERAA